MNHYVVKYEIEVYAETPIKAALEVEDILNKQIYRPCLTVMDNKQREVVIDLNLEEYKYLHFNTK